MLLIDEGRPVMDGDTDTVVDASIEATGNQLVPVIVASVWVARATHALARRRVKI